MVTAKSLLLGLSFWFYVVEDLVWCLQHGMHLEYVSRYLAGKVSGGHSSWVRICKVKMGFSEKEKKDLHRRRSTNPRQPDPRYMLCLGCILSQGCRKEEGFHHQN